MKKEPALSIEGEGIRECTGCGACSLICPSQAISMQLANNGFYEPVVNSDLCSECGLCLTVCYKFADFDSNNEPFKKATVIAVTNNYIDDISTVSTIGVASRLAEYFFELGYNVCGVKYDYQNHCCNHSIASSLFDLIQFKGSKYLPSYTERAFRELINSKKQGIVFGTPCQIYGLRQVVDSLKISDRFIFIDLFCAGVPSLLLWKKYLSFLNRKHSIEQLSKLNFRDKNQGWHKFSMYVEDSAGRRYRKNIYNDIFLAFFLKKVCLSQACYKCKFRRDYAASDIRLGDFWGKKYIVWDDGVQLMTIFSTVGKRVWESISDIFAYEVCKEEDLYDAQKGGAMRMIKEPSCRRKILDALSGPELLEDIFMRFNISKIPMGGS